MTWLERAACRGMDAAAWFDPARQREAVTVCVVDCPVRADCLAHALRGERRAGGSFRAGIYGGLTPRQRARGDDWPAKLRDRFLARLRDAPASSQELTGGSDPRNHWRHQLVLTRLVLDRLVRQDEDCRWVAV